uniref:Integrase catalytic domain-containing protein n=1 Tax=Trichogramma kaykai TaxID=54128 RepID=A0ABD2WQE0_9HYME
MLDNGATVNLIKLSAVAPDVEIFRDRYLSLGGITSEPVETLDYIYVSICSPSYRFYVVPNDFPIEADGLIGRNLMKKEQAVISYHYSSIVLRSDHLNPIPFAEPNPQVENPTTNIFKVSRNRAGIPSINYVAPTTINQYQDYCEDRDFVAECDELCNQATILPERQRITIPGRSRKIIHIGLMHTHLDEGYLPRINLGYDDVYVGEGIVKNEAGYCNIYAINTRVEEVELALDPVEIQPFDYVVQDFESDGATEVDTPPIEDVKTRGDRILKTLRLEELNPEEKENIQKIVTDYPDLFLLPGDSLPCTNWVYHEVPLENNIPINTKQYRHPPIHRDAINKDVDTGLRRRSNLTRPMAAIPEEATSMTNQREITDQENCPTETPPLVDPRYSVLRQEFTNTEIPTDDETQSQIQEENYPTVLDTTTSSEDKTHAIITAPPITDSNISESEDTLEETEEVFTQLSDSELLKAANEINISQTLINKKALELEDINTEMELEDNELGNKSCFSEGDCADEETRDYLDSIDTFDERNFTDKTLTDKINQLVAKSLAATKDSDVLIRGGEHNHINQNNLHATSHVNPRVGTPRFQSTPLPTRLIPPKPQPSIEIAQNQNDTPVVLNFTQPSVPDFPIFVPVPMDETPMNRYKPAYITTDNPLDEDSINEQMPGHNITMSRNCLTYKSDNYIHFISQDCGPYTKNSRLLSDIGAIDYKDIRSQKPSIGQILAVKYKSNYILLTVITARHSDPISGQKVREAMKNLKEFMITNKLNSARIARKGEPQTNGSLEKSHAPLIDFIRTYSENYDDWDKLAPFTTFAYNTSVHSATNFTPYELVYGKTARFPLNIPTEDRLPTYNIYLQDLITRLTEMKNLASDRQQNKKEITKKRYDKKARPFGGSAGDHAWVLNEPRVGKFDIYYKTPLLVKEILGNNTAILQLPTGQLIRKHLDKLKAVPQ